MKNLSEFKKSLKIGTKIHTVYHCESNGRDEKGQLIFMDKDRGIREVSVVQSNAFALKTVKSDGSTHDSFCQYPKAADVVINQDGSITIMEEDYRRKDEKIKMPVLTFKIIE